MSNYSQILKETADELRLIDDVLFRLVASRKAVCQELLRTFLDDAGLEVESVTVQKNLPSLHRGVVLDALCTLSDGRISNIEVQKAGGNDDIRRTRFHAASVTTNCTPKGTLFQDIPDVSIIYITEYDALNNQQAFTEIRRYQKIRGEILPVEDGERIYLANTVVKDGSKYSELLSLFEERKIFFDSRFKELSGAVQYYKNTEKGRDEVSTTLAEFVEEQKEQGRLEGSIFTLYELGYTISEIAEKVNQEEEKILKILDIEG